MNIKRIISEELTRLPFKFHEGGYLIPSNKQEANQWLTEGEFQRLKKLNNNLKELYENEVEKLRLTKLHNRGVMQKAMDKIKSEPNFNFKND
jgi:hypothetical protein